MRRRRLGFAIVGVLLALMVTAGLAWAGEIAWSPPDELSEQQADAIPAGTATYGPADQGTADQAVGQDGVQGFDPGGSPDPAPSDVLGSDPAAD
ncbi:MAG: hypothetical protein M3295_00600 [Chloroflexota bacterium]|nr:hypothetical protein [Chloroflexota bacterium]